MPVLTEKRLTEFCSKVLKQLGASDEEAERVTTHLVTNNLMGHDSHGVIQLANYAHQIKRGEIKPGAKMEIVRETPCTAVLDGNWGFGQLIAKKAMEMAIEKAGRNSISCLSVRNCNHIGRLGEYSTMAAERNMIGIISANDHGTGLIMAPYGGITRKLSPNPISIAFPSNRDHPILLDMSCTVVAQGKLLVKRSRKENIPEGWAIDVSGKSITNPNDYWGPPEGAILPLGGSVAGHKGFGLGFVLDVLDGVLGGAGCSREDATRDGNGLFIIAINITDFVHLDEFRREVEQFTRHVKSSALAPGFTEILVPGDSEYREQIKRRKDGIMIEEETWRTILEIAHEVGLNLDIA
ncbi:MAG: Ldh family oxidoreductase [Candidatus Bathyarchaeia archaeon]